MSAEQLELTPAERLQTSFAVAVVKTSLPHDSECGSDLGVACTCDLEKTAREVLGAIRGWVVGPTSEAFHSLVLMDLQNSDPGVTALTADAAPGSVAAHTSPSPG